MKDQFRFLKENDEDTRLERLLQDNLSIFDVDFLLSLYNEAVEAKKEFAKERKETGRKKAILAKTAKELGGVLTGVDFEGDNLIPSDGEMADAIEKIRLLYLSALMAKNFHLLIEAADKGEHGLTHFFKDETKIGRSPWKRWEYVIRHNYVTIPCQEKITAKCLAIESDMDVLEWKGSGYDREGDWRETGFPSKWNNYAWRLPKSIKVVTGILWKDAKVKCNQYRDFRRLFFYQSGGGTGNGTGEFHHSITPVIWSSFGVHEDAMQDKYPLGGISWDNITDVTEIKIRLRDDDRYIGELKMLNDNE